MNRIAIPAFALVTLAALTSSAQVHADPAPPKVTLVIDAVGFKGTKGQALFALYESGDTWLKIPRAAKLIRLPIGGDKVQVTFADLTPGIYGVSVIHDENTNNKLDMHWFPVPGPDEGAGVSNDATATFGPPSWNDSRFRLSERGGVLTVHVRY